MKNALMLWLCCAGFVLVPSAQATDLTDEHRLAPPSRPIPVSMAQFQALNALAAQPQHAWVADTSAAYSPERARKMTEAGVVASQFVVPGSILLFLLAAAPL